MNTNRHFLLPTLPLSLLMMMLIPQTAQSAPKIFYVSPTGSDSHGNGSVTKPWKTLHHAADTVSSGNTIHLKAGTFLETQPTKLAVGVHLEGEGVERTILRSSLDKAYLITLFTTRNTTGNQHIGGFTIEGNDKTLRGGILVENVNNVTLHHIHFVRCKEAGSTVVDSSSRAWENLPTTYVTGIKIHDCQYTNCASIPFKKADGSPAGMSGNLQIGGLDGAEVFNIRIDDIARPGTEEGYGIKFGAGGYFKNLKIHDCKIRVHETAKAWVSNCSVELWNVGPGCEISRVNANTMFSFVNTEAFDQQVVNTQNLKMHDCIVINQKAGGSNNEAIEASISGLEVYRNYFENASIGIAFWGRGNHIFVHNNIFCNTKPMDKVWGQFPPTGMWLDIGNGVYKDVKIYNNVFDSYSDGIRFNTVNDTDSPNGNFDGVDIQNNAFLGTTNAIWETNGNREAGRLTNVTFQYNLKDNETVWLKNTTAVVSASNIQGNPGYHLTGNRWDLYYKPLSKDSYCVDRGAVVKLPYSGSTADIGSYEYEKQKN